jgi:hypothetical protein
VEAVGTHLVDLAILPLPVLEVLVEAAMVDLETNLITLHKPLV